MSSYDTILMFGEFIQVSDRFIKATKLKELRNSDIGETLLSITNSIYEAQSTITDEHYKEMIRRLIVLLSSYYIGHNKEKDISLKYVLSLMYKDVPLEGAVMMFVAEFAINIISIITFLEVDDRFLIDEDDWMATLIELYNTLENGYFSKYLNKQHWKTIENKFSNAYIVSLVERYILPGNADIKLERLGERIMRFQQELQQDRFNFMRCSTLNIVPFNLESVYRSNFPFSWRLYWDIDQGDI